MDKIIEKWDSLGFLFGLTDENKVILANHLETLACFLMENHEEYKDGIVGCSLPIIRRVLVLSEFKYELKDIKYFMESITSIIDSSEFKSKSQSIIFVNYIDVEAEMMNYVAEEYLNNINIDGRNM